MSQFGTFFFIVCIFMATLAQKVNISEFSKEQLMKTDLELINNLDQYANKLEERINLLQRISDEISQPLNEAKGKEEEYLGNPLNSFPLVRHMHSDWELVEALMANQVGQEQIDFLKEKLFELPLHTDLAEAAYAISRIEHVYNVKPENMANGLVDGVQYNGTFSALECYVMAVHNMRYKEFQNASKWLIVVLQLMSFADPAVFNVLELRRDHVNLLLARCYMEMGKNEQARQVLNNDSVKYEHLRLAREFNVKPDPVNNGIHLNVAAILPKEYSVLCRSSYKPKPSRLQCRYNTTTTAFLKLAPFRMEVLSMNPYIVAYHNILSDWEIKELVRITKPLLIRAEVNNQKLKYANVFRTVNGAWIPNIEMNASVEDLKTISRIFLRMSDLTGLKSKYINGFQVLRYDIGGHYTPHYDYFNATLATATENDDRIASVLFYLNDVTHGGATVFPHLNLTVPAEKGKVLFWYNLDGETYDYDVYTWHGACPVIEGKKHAMTSWISELDQMFIKPVYRPGNRVVL